MFRRHLVSTRMGGIPDLITATGNALLPQLAMRYYTSLKRFYVPGIFIRIRAKPSDSCGSPAKEKKLATKTPKRVLYDIHTYKFYFQDNRENKKKLEPQQNF